MYGLPNLGLVNMKHPPCKFEGMSKGINMVHAEQSERGYRSKNVDNRGYISDSGYISQKKRVEFRNVNNSGYISEKAWVHIRGYNE